MIIFDKFFKSSIGKKIVVAVTGICLALFLVAHMAGNLQIFGKPAAINSYAETLHSHPGIVWTFRLGLLVFFLLHILLAVILTVKNWSARPDSYQCNSTVQASVASRIMIWTGLFIFAFVVYHLLHFTVGAVHSNFFVAGLPLLDNQKNVHAMVVKSFQVRPIAGAYIVFMVLLALHLYHGIGSVFQTLGLVREGAYGLLTKVSVAFLAIVVGGLVAIPVAFFQ